MHSLLRCQIVHGDKSVWWKHSSSSSSSHSKLSSNCASHYCPSLNCLSAIIHLCLPHLHLLLICTCVTDWRHERTQRRSLRQTARTVACISEFCGVSEDISVDPWCSGKVQKDLEDLHADFPLMIHESKQPKPISPWPWWTVDAAEDTKIQSIAWEQPRALLLPTCLRPHHPGNWMDSGSSSVRTEKSKGLLR